jgi:hypothetical protein
VQENVIVRIGYDNRVSGGYVEHRGQIQDVGDQLFRRQR